MHAQVPPSDNKTEEEGSGDEVTKERARMASQLADAKKKFMAVAKRKQQDYNKKVNQSKSYFLTCAPLRVPGSKHPLGLLSRLTQTGMLF